MDAEVDYRLVEGGGEQIQLDALTAWTDSPATDRFTYFHFTRWKKRLLPKPTN